METVEVSISTAVRGLKIDVQCVWNRVRVREFLDESIGETVTGSIAALPICTVRSYRGPVVAVVESGEPDPILFQVVHSLVPLLNP